MNNNATKGVIGSPKSEFLQTIARMYYILGMNQATIATKLNISRSSVARFLSEARELGIVEIRIAGSNDTIRNSEFEDALIKKYKLRDAIIINGDNKTHYYSNAASYIKSILPHNGIVAIGGGSTLYSIGANITHNTDMPDLHCIQSTGIMAETVPSTAVVQVWASNLGAVPHYFSSPAIVCDKATRKILLESALFKSNYALLRSADICIFGIGTSDQMIRSNQTNPDIQPYLNAIQNTCVGDVCFHLYDDNGDFCMSDLSNRICGISQVELLKIPIRIATAIGLEKVRSIHAALTGRIANILISDKETAHHLLDIN